jgi:hypothetical protein
MERLSNLNAVLLREDDRSNFTYIFKQSDKALLAGGGLLKRPISYLGAHLYLR